MPADAKSFDDLLTEAPLAATSDVVSLVGALSRTQDPKKFVITVADGQQFTIDRDAVKGHTVLGGAIGQPIVRVDLDAARAPEAVKETPAANPSLQNKVVYDNASYLYYTGFHHDTPRTGVTDPVIPAPQIDDPYATALAPFLLATGHHADPGLISALFPQPSPGYGAYAPYGAYPYLVRKPPILDRPKRPQEDGTFRPHTDY